MEVGNAQAWWQYGILGVAVLVFATVIRFLFRKYEAQIQKGVDERLVMEKERAAWAVERERLRSEYDQKHHDLLREYAQKLQEEHEKCQEREDGLRTGYDERIEKMSSEQQKASDALVTMLEKLQERFVFREKGRY